MRIERWTPAGKVHASTFPIPTLIAVEEGTVFVWLWACWLIRRRRFESQHGEKP